MVRTGPVLATALLFACAAPRPVHVAPPAPIAAAPVPVVVEETATATITEVAEIAEVASATVAAADEPDEVAEVDNDGEPPDPERDASGPVDGALRYTNDLSDEELTRRWREAPDSLGSISIGFTDEGRLINAKPFPRDGGPDWTVVSPAGTWATTETIDYVLAAIHRVRSLHPDAPPLRVNEISLPEGGWIRPHRSHQNGRDVDLGFYYPTAEPPRVREREKVIDKALSWELVKSLIITGDVQFILVDKRVQKVLYEHALAAGEDKAWLDTLFFAGSRSIVQHARRHRDHFHVRYYNPRAQELGRRVTPLLAERPDQNLVMYRVRSGDTLGAIAKKHRSNVKLIQKANHMTNSFLKLGRVLRVPTHGPCTQCPTPPILELPPRRLPPSAMPVAVTTSPEAPQASASHAPVLSAE